MTTSTAIEREDPETNAPEAFVGRQAIYDGDLEVIGYELLFRTGDGTGPGETCGDRATSEVILTTFMDIGLERIVGDHPAFINMTRNFLVDPRALPFPPERVVLEVLEDTEVDAELVDAVTKLVEAGYRIALDDFVFDPSWVPLLELAEFVKLDVLGAEPDALAQALEQMRRYDVRLLAEKVETREEFEQLLEMGFELFQGFFLSRPHVISGKRIAENRLSTMRLLAKLQDPKVDMDEIEDLVARDLPLTYKLLRYLNSPAVAVRSEVTTIRRAVVMLGLEKLRRWTSLVLLARGKDQPSELLNLALVRARMCENLAGERGAASTDAYFTAGMLSALDLLVGMPMTDLLEQLPLADELRDALGEQAGPIGEALGCALAYEGCRFGAAHFSDLEPDRIREAYVEASAWAFEAQRGLEEA